MIKGIHHVALSVRDLDRSLTFYRDLLGMDLINQRAFGNSEFDVIMGLTDARGRIAVLASGNLKVELFEFSNPRPRPGEAGRPVCDHGITHICLEVEDIENEYARLERRGVDFHCAPLTFPIAKATYGRDPDGNVFELIEFVNKEL